MKIKENKTTTTPSLVEQTSSRYQKQEPTLVWKAFPPPWALAATFSSRRFYGLGSFFAFLLPACDDSNTNADSKQSDWNLPPFAFRPSPGGPHIRAKASRSACSQWSEDLIRMRCFRRMKEQKVPALGEFPRRLWRSDVVTVCPLASILLIFF